MSYGSVDLGEVEVEVGLRVFAALGEGRFEFECIPQRSRRGDLAGEGLLLFAGWGVSGVLCKRLGLWSVSFLVEIGLEVEVYLAGEVDGELVEGCRPVFDRVGPFLLGVA